jgi:hypothetical protein
VDSSCYCMCAIARLSVKISVVWRFCPVIATILDRDQCTFTMPLFLIDHATVHVRNFLLTDLHAGETEIHFPSPRAAAAALLLYRRRCGHSRYRFAGFINFHKLQITQSLTGAGLGPAWSAGASLGACRKRPARALASDRERARLRAEPSEAQAVRVSTRELRRPESRMLRSEAK